MKKAKVVSVLLALTLTITGATAITAQAFSSGGGKSGIGNYASFANKGRGANDGAQTSSSKLASLVTAGTITQDQATAIEKAIADARPQNQNNDQHSNTNQTQGQTRGTANGPLSALVTAGTITQDQEKAVMQAIMDAMKTNKGNFDISTVLAGLVTSGTITSDQSTAIQTAISSTKTDRTGNQTQGKTRGTANGPLSALVTAGTITQDQEKAVMQAIMDAMKTNKGSFDISTVLAGLVTSGTITSDQSTAIQTAISSAKTQRPNTNQTQGEKGTRQNELKTILDKLVTAGTITSDQETAVLNVLQSNSSR